MILASIYIRRDKRGGSVKAAISVSAVPSEGILAQHFEFSNIEGKFRTSRPIPVRT